MSESRNAGTDLAEAEVVRVYIWLCVCVFGRPCIMTATEGWSEIMLMDANYDLGDQLRCQFIYLIKPLLFNPNITGCSKCSARPLRERRSANFR